MSLIQTLLLRAGFAQVSPFEALLNPPIVSPRWRGPTPKRANAPKARRLAREERRPRYPQLSNPERNAERKALRALGRRQWRLVHKRHPVFF